MSRNDSLSVKSGCYNSAKAEKIILPERPGGSEDIADIHKIVDDKRVWEIGRAHV